MFYLQHGFGKGTKIGHVADEGNVGGVILSPAHEDRFRLRETVTACRSIGLDVLLDPQSYVYTLTPKGSARNHGDHGLELSELHWSQTADAVKRHVDAVQTANTEVGIDGPWVTPAPFQASLTDFWMPISLQYARTASAAWGEDQTMVSVILDEDLLRSWSPIQEWLDVLTTLEVRGFYIAVNRSRPLYPPQAWVPEALCNLLRVIYTLSEINDYEVVWGYADIDGLLGTAVGATGIASGWTYGLRQFSVSRWNEKRSGGQSAVPRIHLRRLWSPLRNNEAEDVFGTDLGRGMFPKQLRAEFDRRGFQAWNNTQAQEQHLGLLARRVAALEARGTLTARLDLVTGSLDTAVQSFKTLADEGLTLESRNLARVRSYQDALALFRSAESL